MEDTWTIQWTKDPNGKTIGTFKDSHGRVCTISKASWMPEPRIFIATAASAIVLSPVLCAELALVLGYAAVSNGELPDTEISTEEEVSNEREE